MREEVVEHRCWLDRDYDGYAALNRLFPQADFGTQQFSSYDFWDLEVEAYCEFAHVFPIYTEKGCSPGVVRFFTTHGTYYKWYDDVYQGHSDAYEYALLRIGYPMKGNLWGVPLSDIETYFKTLISLQSSSL